jgi:hypothetical protein
MVEAAGVEPDSFPSARHAACRVACKRRDDHLKDLLGASGSNGITERLPTVTRSVMSGLQYAFPRKSVGTKVKILNQGIKLKNSVMNAFLASLFVICHPCLHD